MFVTSNQHPLNIGPDKLRELIKTDKKDYLIITNKNFGPLTSPNKSNDQAESNDQAVYRKPDITNYNKIHENLSYKGHVNKESGAVSHMDLGPNNIPCDYCVKASNGRQNNIGKDYNKEHSKKPYLYIFSIFSL